MGHGRGVPPERSSPRVCVDGSLVPTASAVGAVLRADVEVGLEGIEVLSLASVKPARSPEKVEGRIEVVGTPKRAPDVSVMLAPGSAKRSRRRDEEDGDDRRDRKGQGEQPSQRGPRWRASRWQRRSVPAVSGGGGGSSGPRRPGSRRSAEGGEGRGAGASVRSPRHRPCTATPCWPRCDRSRSRWPSSCSAVAFPPCVKRSTPRTRRPRPRASRRRPPTP